MANGYHIRQHSLRDLTFLCCVDTSKNFWIKITDYSVCQGHSLQFPLFLFFNPLQFLLFCFQIVPIVLNIIFLVSYLCISAILWLVKVIGTEHAALLGTVVLNIVRPVCYRYFQTIRLIQIGRLLLLSCLLYFIILKVLFTNRFGL